jgi:prolyl oligopeptidase
MKIGAPSKEGNFTYYSKNDGLQNQSVYRKDAAGKERFS